MHQDPTEFLPEFFRNIPDHILLTTKEMEQVTNGYKSEVTYRRWCREGAIKLEGKNPFKAYGIEIKKKIFKDMYPQIRSRCAWLS